MTDLDRAEARAAIARERLNHTVGSLQAQLEPQVLMQKAKDSVADGGERAARASVKVAQRNPAALAGGAALLVTVLARHRIAAGVRRLFGRKKTPPPTPPVIDHIRDDDAAERTLP